MPLVEQRRQVVAGVLLVEGPHAAWRPRCGAPDRASSFRCPWNFARGARGSGRRARAAGPCAPARASCGRALGAARARAAPAPLQHASEAPPRPLLRGRLSVCSSSPAAGLASSAEREPRSREARPREAQPRQAGPRRPREARRPREPRPRRARRPQERVHPLPFN